jgi:endoglucanase
MTSNIRVALVAVATLALVTSLTASADAVPLSIQVSGNRFVDGSGQAVQLVGVNRSSTEYACFYGYAYANGPLDGSDAVAIASWHANAVRIPLNEDCWLGIDGYPAGGLTAAGYRQAIESYVQALHADGLYAILDLHWSAPGATPADGQRPLPDPHSLDFWSSVAGAFENDPAAVFDAFNEPYSPAANGDAAYPVSWACWENGGCTVPDANDQQPIDPAQTYAGVGMQEIVSAIRAAGASQPILLGGLGYANDLSRWLAHEPTDPKQQLAASFHNYTGEGCATEACWNATIAPVAARVPVVTGEFGEDDCPSGGDDPDNFDNTYMSWADAHGSGYLGWAWIVLEPSERLCSALYLITDYAGTPADPNGVALHDHLAALFGPSPPTPLLAPRNIRRPRVRSKFKNRTALVANKGRWTGTTPIAYAYQWQSCNRRARKCKSIRGATKRTRRLGAKSVGHRLKVVVTATNAVGRASAISNATAVVKK